MAGKWIGGTYSFSDGGVDFPANGGKTQRIYAAEESPRRKKHSEYAYRRDVWQVNGIELF